MFIRPLASKQYARDSIEFRAKRRVIYFNSPHLMFLRIASELADPPRQLQMPSEFLEHGAIFEGMA